MIELALTIALAIILVPIILWAGVLVLVAIIKILENWKWWLPVAGWLAFGVFVSVAVMLV